MTKYKCCWYTSSTLTQGRTSTPLTPRPSNIFRGFRGVTSTLPRSKFESRLPVSETGVTTRLRQDTTQGGRRKWKGRKVTVTNSRLKRNPGETCVILTSVPWEGQRDGTREGETTGPFGYLGKSLIVKIQAFYFIDSKFPLVNIILCR